MRAGEVEVLVAGLGNIGSQVAPALARLPEVGGITLVDPDTYEPGNLATQAIRLGAMGRPKVEVVAEDLWRIQPELRVSAIPERLEEVPWGLLRADVVLGCLDTKAARRDLNRIAGRMGAAYVDAGVEAAGLLARVSVFPAESGVCLECGWGRADYANLEVGHPCQGGQAGGAATNAPAYLGQLAGALQVLECHRLIRAAVEMDGSGAVECEAFEILMDARSRTYYHSRFRANPACRFVHGKIQTEVISLGPAEVSLGSLLREGCALRVEGDAFVRDLVCPGCGGREEALVLGRRLGMMSPDCGRCGEGLQPLGFTMVDEVEADRLGEEVRAQSFAGLGFLPGDIFQVFAPSSVTGARESRFYQWKVDCAEEGNA